MLRRDYADQVCSLSRALEVVGERWSLLVVRDVILGRHRFDQIVASLGVTRTVLTTRLRHLVAEGVLERLPYRERPTRYEYHLTAKGRDLVPAIAHLLWWGDRYYPAPGGPPCVLRHRGCGGEVSGDFSCEACGARLGPEDVVAEPGLGHAPPDPSAATQPLTPG